MGNPKWTIGFLFVFVIFTILGSIGEGADINVGMTRMETLLDLSWDLLWPPNAVSYIGNIFPDIPRKCSFLFYIDFS